jgi:succinate dehydrogenase/fumarate reductase flavoprotein subunit
VKDGSLIEHEYDVVCVGGGGGGITAAVTAARHGARVALICKEPIGYGNTRISGGGVATDDVPQDFFDDIMASGHGLNQAGLARVVAEGSAGAVALLQEYGNVFLKKPDGSIDVRYRGGHRRARSAMCAARGRSLGQSLRGAVARERVDVFEEMLAASLLTQDGAISGLVALDLVEGEFHQFSAPAVILATGGAGALYYPHTDCVRSALGDGFALALEAGAELVDMEQMQFLPFAVTHPRAYQGLYCGEPSNLAGPEGRLLNAKGDLLLDHMNTATRGKVSDIMWRAMEEGATTKYGGLLLDISRNPDKGSKAIIAKAGESFEVVRYAYGKAAYEGQEPLDVAPTGHFSLGGIRADERGRTGVGGLFAIGEAQGGVHGGNRLAGVALVEMVVFGKVAGEEAARLKGRAAGVSTREQATSFVQSIAEAMTRPAGDRPIALKQQIFGLMWESMGGIRSEERCLRGLSKLAQVRGSLDSCRVAAIKKYNTELLDYLELRLMLVTAEAMVGSALARRESRGTHVRQDFPAPDDTRGPRNVVCDMKAGHLACTWLQH